jgi:hypothetical protein
LFEQHGRILQIEVVDSFVVQASEVPTHHRSYALGRAIEGEIQCLISWFVVHARKSATNNHHEFRKSATTNHHEFRKQTECVGSMHVHHPYVLTFGSVKHILRLCLFKLLLLLLGSKSGSPNKQPKIAKRWLEALHRNTLHGPLSNRSESRAAFSCFPSFPNLKRQRYPDRFQLFTKTATPYIYQPKRFWPSTPSHFPQAFLFPSHGG